MHPISVSGIELVVGGVKYSEVSPLRHPEYEKVPLYRLKPHERIIDDHVREVAQQIREVGRINRPIPVSRWAYREGDVTKYSDVILDGHHRFAALNLLVDQEYEIDFVPVHVVSYNSHRVQVDLWPTAKIRKVDKTDVITAGFTGNLMGHKTTRHFFDPPLPERPTLLENLRSPNRRVVHPSSIAPIQVDFP